LRLACGVAQGLAWGLDLPVLPVSTLEALALASGDGDVWTCLDARMNEVYAPPIGLPANPSRSSWRRPACRPPWRQRRLSSGGWGVGDGFAAHGELLRARKPDLAGVAPDAFPTAAAVLRLAAPAFAGVLAVPAARRSRSMCATRWP
jgi:tRNA threonylcarbamoyladenosine biosynthesis protein TsaB